MPEWTPVEPSTRPGGLPGLTLPPPIDPGPPALPQAGRRLRAAAIAVLALLLTSAAITAIVVGFGLNRPAGQASTSPAPTSTRTEVPAPKPSRRPEPISLVGGETARVAAARFVAAWSSADCELLERASTDSYRREAGVVDCPAFVALSTEFQQSALEFHSDYSGSVPDSPSQSIVYTDESYVRADTGGREAERVAYTVTSTPEG